MSTSHVMAACALGLYLLNPGFAAAQSATTPKSDVSGTEPSSVADVEKWTNKQWQAAKLVWAKDKIKWSECRAQSELQHLAGRKSWSFLYTCMTS